MIIPRIFRFLTKLVAVLLVTITLLLLILRFSPQTVLYLANVYSPITIIAERVDTEFLPLTFKFKNIRLSEGKDQQFANLGSLRLSADWVGAIKGQQNFWDIALSDGMVDLRKLPDQKDSPEPQANVEPTPKIDLHRLISTLSARVSNVKLIINDDGYLDLQKIESTSNTNTSTQLNDLKQNISMQFVYALDETPLVINANMESQHNKGLTDIALQLAEIDLSPLLRATSNTQKNDASTSSNGSAANEQEMDWTWLNLIDATRITLSVDNLRYPGVDAQNVYSQVTLDENIDFEVSSNLSLALAERWKFEDSFKLEGKLTPIADKTGAADLNGAIHLETPKIDISLQGDFNLNGQFNNKLQIAISAAQLPIETIPETPTESLIGSFFPLIAKFKVQGESPNLSLSNIDLKLGVSDLRGEINLSIADAAPLQISAQLNSEKLVLGSPSNQEQATELVVVETDKDNKLFSTTPIDWSWLDSPEVDLLISIKDLNLTKYQLYDLNLPIALSDGQLAIAPLTAQFAGGAWASSISMRRLDQGIVLELESDLKDASLEAMNLIPKDQITQGDTNFNIRLESKGSSPQELVEALQGKLLLEIREGQIANDYFEIIGSDLFSELLSKLNPFVKSDPSTELKCMIANLRFDQGDIQVDKSIALETSKISIVADGKIDLVDEKIKLKIVPKTENGIGLGIGTLVKSVSLGGSLTNPVPHVTAGDLLKSGLAIGAALTTGGTSLLADGLLNKAVGANACTRAEKAFTDEAEKLDAIEQEELLKQKLLLETQSEAISPLD